MHQSCCNHCRYIWAFEPFIIESTTFCSNESFDTSSTIGDLLYAWYCGVGDDHRTSLQLRLGSRRAETVFSGDILSHCPEGYNMAYHRTLSPPSSSSALSLPSLLTRYPSSPHLLSTTSIILAPAMRRWWTPSTFAATTNG